MYGCGKDCLSLIPFTLPQINCFTLSLKCFFSDSDNCPDVRIRPLLQFPHPPRAGPVLLILPFSLPSSFILPSFVWVYIFFSAGEVLLSTLSCCSPYTSVSEGVFLMYRGERCIPHPPTPPPSCSSSLPALLRCTCHITLYKFKMHNMLICCTHIAKWLPPQC